MTDNPTTADWSEARGKKWRTHLVPTEAMLAPTNDALIDALQFDGPGRIADIGCGGGGATVEILRKAPAGSVVHGFDLSADLVEFALTRVTPGDSIAFEVADMSTASPPGAPYDRLCSRFGIMFFPDAPTAFANLRRWLVPGGRLAFAAWSTSAENPWRMAVRQAVSQVIELPAVDLEAPGPFRYAESGKLLAILEQAGFREAAVHDWRGTLPIGGGMAAGDAASFVLASFSAFDEQLHAAGQGAWDRVHQLLMERFSRHEVDGAVRMDACVHIFTGGR